MFEFGIGKKLKIHEYHSIRWITDMSFIVIGYFIGGVLGVGTVIFLLVAGLVVEFFVGKLKKRIKF